MVKISRTFNEIEKLIDKMLSRSGDPVDKSLSLIEEAENLLAEASEVKQEISRSRINPMHLKEELGDVLWDMILLCKIAEKRKFFTLQEMLELLKAKIKQRNPHVFGKEKANSLKEAIRIKREAKERWQKIRK